MDRGDVSQTRGQHARVLALSGATTADRRAGYNTAGHQQARRIAVAARTPALRSFFPTGAVSTRATPRERHPEWVLSAMWSPYRHGRGLAASTKRGNPRRNRRGLSSRWVGDGREQEKNTLCAVLASRVDHGQAVKPVCRSKSAQAEAQWAAKDFAGDAVQNGGDGGESGG